MQSGFIVPDNIIDFFNIRFSSLHALSDFHGINSLQTKEAKKLLGKKRINSKHIQYFVKWKPSNQAGLCWCWERCWDYSWIKVGLFSYCIRVTWAGWSPNGNDYNCPNTPGTWLQLFCSFSSSFPLRRNLKSRKTICPRPIYHSGSDSNFLPEQL